VAKTGEAIKPNVASVLGKLNILPMKVGFEPLAAYDSADDKLYIGIKIDKKAALNELRSLIGKALSFAVNLGFTNKETIKYILAKASFEEKAIERLIAEKKPKENVQEVEIKSKEETK
jgi:hypothetical protein